MNILFNVTTRRGIVSILPLMRELKSRGHDIYTLVTTHPSRGLAHPYQFMIGEDSTMLNLLGEMPTYTIHRGMDSQGDLVGMICDIKKWDIDLHVTKGDSGLPRDRLLCSYIKGRIPNIRIVCQQADWHMHIQKPWYSDHFMVMGPRWGDYLVNQGVSADNITPVGCIKGDYLRTLPHLSDEYITFFSQMSYNDEQKIGILKALIQLSDKFGKTAIVKLHPAWEQYNVDEWGWWQHQSIELGGTNISLRYMDDPYALAQRSALTITGFSNTGYEAMIMGVPVLLINISGHADLYKGCGVDIYNTDDIVDTGSRLMDAGYDTTMVAEWMYGQVYINDGKSSGRAADCIEELTPNRRDL